MAKALTQALILLLCLPIAAHAEERVGVFEFFVRGSGEYCIAAAPSVIALQNAMQGRAVILEYPYDTFNSGRVDRFWSAYSGPSPYLPLVVVGSGFQICQGPVTYSTLYRQMLEAELVRPPRASIKAWSRRSGSSLRIFATAKNLGSETLTLDRHPTFWLIVWEDGRIGLTNTWVRATASRALTSQILSGGTTNVTLEVPSISPLDWQHVRALVLLDDRPPGGSRWDMLQATIAEPACLSVTPTAITLDSVEPEAVVTLDGPYVLGFTATTDASWLSVSPESGTIPGSVTIRLVGYSTTDTPAVVRISASGSGMSFTEDVVVTATGEPPAVRPFPQHVSYAEGTIRPDRHDQAQQDNDIRARYDAWKQNALVQEGAADDGSPLYRVRSDRADPDRALSRGQGYGMMIVAWMAGYESDAREIFDGLWNFSRAHPSPIDGRLMNRDVPATSGEEGSAFGGDCDIAYALLLGDAQWGSDGAIDYLSEAKSLIDGILSSTIGPQSHLPMLGDWVEAGGDPYNQFTVRSSDLMVDHFRAFARATGEPEWWKVVEASQSLIASMQANHSPVAGLLPDFIVDADTKAAPASRDFLEGSNDGSYASNAARVPWRLGFDALVSGNAISTAQVRMISRWAETTTGGLLSELRSGYTLDGTPIDDGEGFSCLIAAPLGVAAMTDASQQQWLNDIYDAIRATAGSRDEESVTLLSMLVMAGNAWAPEIRLVRRRGVRRP